MIIFRSSILLNQFSLAAQQEVNKTHFLYISSSHAFIYADAFFAVVASSTKYTKPLKETSEWLVKLISHVREVE